MAPMNIKVNPLGGAVCIVILLCMFLYMFGLPAWLSGHEERISMKELLSAGIVLARRGGDRVRDIRRQNSLEEKVKGKTKEGANEMVSQGDMESHRAIVHGFSKAFPGLGVVSEEHETQPVDFSRIPDIDKHLAEVEQVIKTDQSIPLNQIMVWIDPLDATQEYTEEFDKDGTDMLPFVTTMVCVAVNGQPTIGIIHSPFVNNDKGETSPSLKSLARPLVGHSSGAVRIACDMQVDGMQGSEGLKLTWKKVTENDCTWGWVGYGHSTNLQKTSELKRKETDPHKLIVSRSHAGAVEETAKQAFGNNVVVTPAGGAGYKTLEVIKGHQHAYLHTTLIKKWDICAGNAILNALDGKMTTLEENFIDYSSGKDYRNENGLLATVYNHQEYLDKLKSTLKKS